ncbi:TOBE domain-containing protein [Pararobbsia silviterrae]|uniref:Transporter n=1 Tax=Pararobbsia silviterrae TaxID=1792498 RepID=A0A494XDN8_9BURK|nr:TOBE domain-containing protein [Pararobbsia silviterrae]RKP46234.1 transporter [Pararobbsia silviterrae]
MKTSARNFLTGTITAIKTGAVNDEVVLKVGNAEIVAIVTSESTKVLGLAAGGTAYALIKASSVILMTDTAPDKISARNVFNGTVKSVKTGAVNAEVVVSAAGLDVTAIITNESASRLDLAPGKPASAVIKASNVILAVD